MRITSLLALLAYSQLSMAQNSAEDYQEHWQTQARSLLESSIAFRTVEFQEQVPAFAEFLAAQFLRGGFAAEDVHVLSMPSDREAVSALVVRYRGNDSSGKKPILFVGHLDVVDAPGEEWRTDPFTLVEIDGNFYGRGVLDDKFATTVLTTTFLRLKNDGYVPSRDLIVVFTGDEESHMDTIQTLTEKHRDLIDAEFAFVLDTGLGRLDDEYKPYADAVQVAEKTYAAFEITARNVGGHSAWPRADNAIYDIADAVKAVQSYQFPAMSNAGTREYFRISAEFEKGPVSDAMRRFAENPNDAAANATLESYPELNALIKTTCVPTLLSGGYVENALPPSATLTVQCRMFPGVPVGDVEAALRRVLDNNELEITSKHLSLTAPPTTPDPLVMAALQRTTNARYPGIAVIPEMEPGTTDAKYLRMAGIPSYGTYGMFMRKQDELSHAANEFLPVREFHAALDYWHRLIIDLTGRKPKN